MEKKNNRRENRESNTRQVFNLILSETNGISRIDISKKTGLSASVITGIADKLISDKLIIESGVIEKKDAGRKAVLLKTNPFGGFFASLIFEKKKIRLEVYDLARKLDAKYVISVDSEKITGDFLIQAIEDAVQYNYKYGTFFGIILTLPPWWIETECKERTQEEFGYYFEEGFKERLHAFYKEIKIYTEPSTAMTACAKLDEVKSQTNVVCVDFDKEIYASFILGGRLFDKRHCTDKFANAIINHDLLPTGKARLKDYLSEEAICSRFVEEIGEKLSVNEIIERYKSGEEKTVNFINKTIEIFAQGIIGFAEILEIDSIILKGTLAKIGKSLADKVKQYFVALDPALEKIEILIENNNELAGLGSAYFAFNNVFSN